MTEPSPPTSLDSTPVLADVVRNGVVESVHHGSVIGIRPDLTVELSHGSVVEPCFPRSALKPVQALAMVELGLDLDAPMLAVACSSHNGEARHIELVEAILASAGLTPADLKNTPDLALHPPAQRAYLAAGGEPDSLHQNCSGKHAAMLATCVVNGWDLATYRDPSHPLQVAIRGTVEELSGEPVAHVAVDGCGAPLFSTSLLGLATCFSRIALGETGTARARVANAMRDHPFEVGGTGRSVTMAMETVPGLIAKDGAEGVYAAATADGTAVALKVSDGNARATAPILVAALVELGVKEDLSAIALTPVLGAGRPVGGVLARPLR